MFRALILTTIVAIYSSVGFAQDRKALVVGIDAYDRLVPLATAVNDSRSLAKQLSSAGWKVTSLANIGSADLQRNLEGFLKSLNREDTALFYFAGHGVQAPDGNYLLARDGFAATTLAVPSNAISLQELLDRIASVTLKRSLVIIDACRSFIGTAANRAANSRVGLAEIAQRVPRGTIVAYSAGSGQEALDGLSASDKDPNGVFTRVLLRELGRERGTVQEVLRATRLGVYELAAGVPHTQLPSIYDATGGPFELSRRKVSPTSTGNNFRGQRLTLSVAGAAGGPTDVITRTFAEVLSRTSGFSFDVENRIDPTGVNTANDVMRSSEVVNKIMVANYGQAIENAAIGLQPIGVFAQLPLVAAVSPDSRYRSLADIWKASQSGNMRIRVATHAIATTPMHRCALEFVRILGADKVELAPFAGGAPAMQAVMDRNIDVICETRPTMQGAINNGKLLAIASLHEDASGTLDPPTAQSEGFGMVVPNWLGLLAGPQFDDKLRAYLESMISTAIADASFHQKLRILGIAQAAPWQLSAESMDIDLRLGVHLRRTSAR